MPNWVECHLAVTGPENVLEELVLSVAKPEAQDCEGNPLVFSCASIAPPPRAIEVHEAMRERSQSLGVAPPKRYGNHEEALANLVRIFNEKTAAAEMGYSSEPFRSDEGWTEKCWGPTRELLDTRLVQEGAGLRGYYFLSAWTPPLPAIDALARLFPEVKMELAAVDPSMQWGLLVAWEEGHRASEDPTKKWRKSDPILIRISRAIWNKDPDPDFLGCSSS